MRTTGLTLSRRWLRLDRRKRMTLGVSAVLAVLINLATAWVYHQTGATGTPRPASSAEQRAPGEDAAGTPRTGLGGRSAVDGSSAGPAGRSIAESFAGRP